MASVPGFAVLSKHLRSSQCQIFLLAFELCAKWLQSCPTLCDPVDRLFCPWDSPGKHTGVGCPSLLQGIFSTNGSNPRLFRLLHWQADSLTLGCHLEAFELLISYSQLLISYVFLLKWEAPHSLIYWFLLPFTLQQASLSPFPTLFIWHLGAPSLAPWSSPFPFMPRAFSSTSMTLCVWGLSLGRHAGESTFLPSPRSCQPMTDSRWWINAPASGAGAVCFLGVPCRFKAHSDNLLTHMPTLASCPPMSFFILSSISLIPNLDCCW